MLLPADEELVDARLKKESMLNRESKDEVCFFAESKVDCMLLNRLLPGAIWMVSGCTIQESERSMMRV